LSRPLDAVADYRNGLVFEHFECFRNREFFACDYVFSCATKINDRPRLRLLARIFMNRLGYRV